MGKSFEERDRVHAQGRIRRWAPWALTGASAGIIILEILQRTVFDESNQSDLSIWLAIALGIVLAFGLLCIIVWRAHRIPKDNPRIRRLRASVSDITLDSSLVHRLFRAEAPPLFTIGKDQQHLDELQEYPTQLQNTLALKSLKCASGNDLQHLCRLAFKLSVAARPRADELLGGMCDQALGVTGTAAVEGRVGVKGRSLVCVGGSDTNPLSARIVRDYSQRWGGYPPLRFTLSTSEVILAQTECGLRPYWENENEEHAMDRTGIVFSCIEPRPALWRLIQQIRQAYRRSVRSEAHWHGEAVQLILAGLHRQGTQASCEVADFLLTQAPDPQLQPTYRYSPKDEFPFALTRLQTTTEAGVDGNNKPIPPKAKLLLQHDGDTRPNFEARSEICAPVAVDAGAKLGIRIGRAFRDYRNDSIRKKHRSFERHVQLSEASRIIDLIVRYTISQDVQIDIKDDIDLTGPAKPPTDAQVLDNLNSFDEIVLVGTPKQNAYVARLIALSGGAVGGQLRRLQSKMDDDMTTDKPVGGFLVTRPLGANSPTIVIAVGTGADTGRWGSEVAPHFCGTDRTTNCVARAAQAALVGLLNTLTAAGPGNSKLARISDLDEGIYTCQISRRESSYPTDKDVLVTVR